MIIYTDIISGEEVISDSYKLVTVDNIVYEVDGKFIVKRNETYNIGANPSAEEQEEALDETSERVIDIIDIFKLQRCYYSEKKDYMSHLKAYMRKIMRSLEKNDASEETINAFKDGVTKYAKKILENFNNYEFYTTRNYADDRMVILLNYREDGTTPYFTIWKDGVIGKKV